MAEELRASMSEQPNPFDILLDRIREIVRDEIGASANGNGKLLTAEQLAEALQVDRVTIYKKVKDDAIPSYQVGRFVRFNLQEVLESQRKINNERPGL